MRRKTQEEFVAEVAQSLPNVEVVGEYVSSRTKVLAVCRECRYSWLANPFDLIYGHGCPRCAGKERKTPERFAYEVSLKNPDVVLLEDYVNASTKIETRCCVCGHEWKANPSTLLAGNGCPSCGGTLKKTHELFVKELAHVNPEIIVIGEYKNNRTKLLVKCRICGHEWKQTPHNLIDARSRCPRCTHSSTSFVEQYIIGFLTQLIAPDEIIERDTEAIGMELDIYVPYLKLAFEPGAWFWHRNKLEADNEKRERCLSQGIRLVTIYDKVPLEEVIHENDVYSFSYDLRVNRDRSEFQTLLVDVYTESSGQECAKAIDWQEVENFAYTHSIKTTTEEYADKLDQRGINVEVIGTYESSSSKIRVKCKTCGHEWSPRADTLLSGKSGCKKCGQASSAKKHLKSNDSFLKEVEERNPTVEVLSPYVKASERVHVRCRLCGHEWDPVANTIAKKHPSACPMCWGGKRNRE